MSLRKGFCLSCVSRSLFPGSRGASVIQGLAQLSPDVLFSAFVLQIVS